MHFFTPKHLSFNSGNYGPLLFFFTYSLLIFAMRLIIFLALLSSPFLAVANNGHLTPVTKAVTVYRNGAKLTSVGKIAVPSGKSEVVFENLSPYFNPQSLQVRLGGNATLNSAVFRIKTPAPAPESPRAQVIRDSIVTINDAMLAFHHEKEVYQAEMDLVGRSAQQIGTIPTGQNTPRLTVEELRALADFYRQRNLDLKKQLQRIALEERKWQERLLRLNEELQTLYPNTANQSGEIVLKMESPSAQTIEISCIYLVYNASWTPLYDLRSDGLDQPLRLVYKANVRNATGFDWKNVKMALSSAMPLTDNNRPILTPVFVDFRPVAYRQQMNNDVRGNVYQMKEAATNMAAAPGAPMADSDGVWEEAEEGGEAPDELLSTFDISRPQDVPSNGEDNIITVEEQEIPAQYQYHAVPKLDPSVFLLAKVTDYGKYNLMPGMANIFFRETFVGQTTINPNTTSDTLLLSLGRDEQVSIKRVQPKDFTERRKIFNSQVKETYAFEIVVKNNKTIPVNVEILDQIPVSRQENIKVKLEGRDGAEYNEELGKLLWKIDVKPGQNKRIKFSYSIEYPKGQNIAVLKN